MGNVDQESGVIYACGECGADASVVDGAIFRMCGHVEAGVTASVSATAYGESSLEGLVGSGGQPSAVLLGLFVDLLALEVAKRIREQAELN